MWPRSLVGGAGAVAGVRAQQRDLAAARRDARRRRAAGGLGVALRRDSAAAVPLAAGRLRGRARARVARAARAGAPPRRGADRRRRPRDRRDRRPALSTGRRRRRVAAGLLGGRAARRGLRPGRVRRARPLARPGLPRRAQPRAVHRRGRASAGDDALLVAAGPARGRRVMLVAGPAPAPPAAAGARPYRAGEAPLAARADDDEIAHPQVLGRT